MIKVYSVTLALGVLGLVIVILGGALSANTGGKVRDPGDMVGVKGKTILGAALGFSMAGMAAEFSPLDFSWQIALLIAFGGLVIGGLWVRYAVRQSDD